MTDMTRDPGTAWYDVKVLDLVRFCSMFVLVQFRSGDQTLVQTSDSEALGMILVRSKEGRPSKRLKKALELANQVSHDQRNCLLRKRR